MADASSLRVADADREQAVDELREHALDGRLTADELEDRVGAAYRATTRGDLEKLKADLPVSSTTVAKALTKRKAQLRRRLAQEAGGSLTVSAICAGAWIAVGAHGAFWPGWVIAFTLMPVVRDGYRLLGPGSDLDVVHARLQARHERRMARGQARHERRMARSRRHQWHRGPGGQW